jgi:hypothetical protein
MGRFSVVIKNGASTSISTLVVLELWGSVSALVSAIATEALALFVKTYTASGLACLDILVQVCSTCHHELELIVGGYES